MKDSDILGEPITGVRYNDRTYTFYPYAGRMASPKGGLLGFIKTAKGRLHGRFYTHGQWFMFEPAPEGREPFLAHYTVGKDVTAEAIVDKLIESDAAETEADVDPGAYVTTLRRKRDIVLSLLDQYALHREWTGTDRLIVTHPKKVRFEDVLRANGAPPHASVRSTSGKNYRTLFLWEPGDLDRVVKD